MKPDFKTLVTDLYTGRSRRSVRFRYGLILFDLITIFFFIVIAALPTTPLIAWINFTIGLVILADFSARLWIAPDRGEALRRIYTLADIAVIIVLFLDPFLGHDFAFLRILRGLRLIHSYYLLDDLRHDSRFFRDHEDAIIATNNLLIFVFVTSSAVFALFFEKATGFGDYVDALYFTVATLTTTGFGDITLETTGGKLFSVVVMVVGVALFVQLAKAIFQPQKVNYTCPSCGLMKHETDAVHCKHCGGIVNIKTPGLE